MFQAPNGWKTAQGRMGGGGGVVGGSILMTQPSACANFSGESKTMEPKALIFFVSCVGVYGSMITSLPTAKPRFASVSIRSAPASDGFSAYVSPGLTRAQYLRIAGGTVKGQGAGPPKQRM